MSGPQPGLGPEPALGHLSELLLTDPVILSHNRAEQAVHKLFLILNAVVRDQLSWQPNRVPTAGEA